MDVGFTEDQQQFRDLVRRFLADKSTPGDVRRLMASESGYDPQVWSQLCGEVGLAGTHLPGAYGGFGFGAVELCIAAEEMGRHLYCGPFFASAVMAAHAVLLAADEEQKQSLLPAMADGSQIAALVLDDLNAVDQVGERIAAHRSGADWQISGTAPMVIDAHIADRLLVVARSDEGQTLFLLETPHSGLEVTPLTTLDATRKLSRVSLQDVPAQLLGKPGGANMERLWELLNTVLANEMIGGASRLFESTIEYMKLRVQFGRTIGSFQALKHRCADLLMELELARAAAYNAAQVLATGTGEPYAASMAKSLAGDAYMAVARAAIQLRGGIGFTWEEDTHLWFKRAKSSEVLLGTPAWHREQMIRTMEGAANVG